MRGENAETSEEKENQARDQNLGKSQGRNKCHLPAWGCQGTNLDLQMNGNETRHVYCKHRKNCECCPVSQLIVR